MNDGKEHNHKIDDFLLGQLNDEEAAAFRKQLDNDPALQKEVALQKKIMRGVKAFNNQELKTRLKEIHREKFGKPQPAKHRILWRYAAVAASFLLLVALAFWLFQPQPPKDLYQAYYEPYSFSTGTRDANERLSAEATALYRRGYFQEALPKLDSLSDRNPDSVEYQLAKGICYLETDQSTLARQIFQQIILSGDALYIDQGRWYLALLLIKENQTEAAIAQLQHLAQDPGADHHEEAQQLLDELTD